MARRRPTASSLPDRIERPGQDARWCRSPVLARPSRVLHVHPVGLSTALRPPSEAPEPSTGASRSAPSADQPRGWGARERRPEELVLDPRREVVTHAQQLGQSCLGRGEQAIARAAAALQRGRVGDQRRRRELTDPPRSAACSIGQERGNPTPRSPRSVPSGSRSGRVRRRRSCPAGASHSSVGRMSGRSTQVPWVLSSGTVPPAFDAHGAWSSAVHAAVEPK